jgi:hypothetical protein
MVIADVFETERVHGASNVTAVRRRSRGNVRSRMDGDGLPKVAWSDIRQKEK